MVRLLLFLIATVVASLIGVFASVSFVDWNGYRTELVEAVETATGTQIIIGGDLSVEFFPSLKLDAEKIEILDDRTHILTASGARFDVKLIPILYDELVISAVTLEEAKIGPALLDRLARSGPGGRYNLSEWDVELNEIKFANSSIHVPRDGMPPIQVRGLDGGIAFARADDQITSAIEFSIGPTRVAVDIRYSEISKKTSPLFIQASAGGDAIVASWDGVVRRDEERSGNNTSGDSIQFPVSSGKVAAEIRNWQVLAELLNRLSTDRNMNQLVGALGNNAAEISGKLTTDTTSARIEDLAVDIGSFQANAGIAANWSATPSVSVMASANNLQLDEIFSSPAVRSAARRIAASFSSDDPKVRVPDRPTIFGDWQVDAELSVDAATYMDGRVRNLRLDGAYDGEGYRIDLMSARLPGGGDATLTGRIDLGEEPSFSGRIDAISDNLRAVTEWLKLPVEQVSPENLRELTLGAEVELSRKRLQVKNWSMEVDNTELHGALDMLFRAVPAFGLSLAVDSLDLDAYAGTEGFLADWQNYKRALLNLPALESFDANLKLRIDRFFFSGKSLSGVAFDGRMQNGRLTLRNLSTSDVDGAIVSLEGEIWRDKESERFDIGVKAHLAEPHRFSQNLPPAFKSSMPAFEAADMEGRLQGNLEQTEFLGRLTSGASEVDVEARFPILRFSDAFDGKISFQLLNDEKAGSLVHRKIFANAAELSEISGDLRVWSSSADRLAGEGTVRLNKGTLKLNAQSGWRLANDPALFDSDIRFSFTHPSLNSVAAAYGTDTGILSEIDEPLSLVGRARYGERDWNIGFSEISVGESHAIGNAEIDYSSPIPVVNAVLDVDRLPFDPLHNIADRIWSEEDGGFSRRRLDLAIGPEYRGTVKLTIADAVIAGRDLSNIVLESECSAGAFEVSKFAADYRGGRLDGRFKWHRSSDPSYSAAFTLSNLPVDGIDLTGIGQISGQVSGDLSFEGSGKSPLLIAGGLSGNVSLTAERVRVDGLDVAEISQAIPSAKSAVSLLELVKSGLSGGASQYDRVIGNLVFTDGAAEWSDVSAEGPAGSVSSNGTWNLAFGEIDQNLEFSLPGAGGLPPFQVRIRGPRDAISRAYNVKDLTAAVLKR